MGKNDELTYFHADCINKICAFENKMVLDLGCGDASMLKYIAEKYQPNYIIGVDLYKVDENGENWKVQSGDARRLEFKDNFFDIIYTISTFEHIDGVEECLSEIRRVLKPRGVCFIKFAPLWTSIVGHHSYSYKTQYGDEKYQSVLKNVPPWGHLYLKKNEMKNYLLNCGMEDTWVNDCIECTYDSDIINRVTASDMKKYIMSSGMLVRSYQEIVAFNRSYVLGYTDRTSELTADIIEKIKKTQYKIEDIGIVYMDVTLEKYESIY